MINKEIKIENLTEQDFDSVRELGLKTPELWDTTEPWYFSKEELKNIIKSPNDICLKATVDGEFARFRIALFNPVIKEAYLMDLAVVEKYRGLGIASAFYIETEKRIKDLGGKSAWALVHEDNHKMMKFIEDNGYKKGRKFVIYSKSF